MRNPMYEARAALALHPRCGAYCRTTGSPCRNPAMANGRCRMHGGLSTGRPTKSGAFTKTFAARITRGKTVADNVADLMILLNQERHCE